MGQNSFAFSFCKRGLIPKPLNSLLSENLMEQLYFVESGRKRLGEKANCLKCNKEFLRRIASKRKKIYCSKSCCFISRQNRTELCCFFCKKIFTRKNSSIKFSRNKIFFCGKKCKDSAQKIESSCSIIKPLHYRYSINHSKHRIAAKDKIKNGCIGCGLKTSFLLTVHHIDGNRKNNMLENLECVCSNCHTIRHLKFINGRWIFSTKYLTDRSKIIEIQEAARAGMFQEGD